MRNAEFDFFDVTRGVAAFWVYLSHLLLICGFWHPLISRGDLAVDVFVMLSGFVIGLMRINKPEPYNRYLFRRLARIYPPFLIALFLGILTSYLYGPVLGWSDYLTPRPEFADRHSVVFGNFWQNFIAHLTMLHGAIPNSVLPFSEYAFSGPLWSISLEWQFYLVAPLLISIFTRSFKLSYILIFLCIYLSGQFAIWLSSAWSSTSPSFLPLRLDYFLLGILSAVAFRPSAHLCFFNRAALVLLVLLAQSFLRGYSLALVIWATTWFIAATAQNSLRLRHISSLLYPLKWFGDRSYGFYVYHMPILLVSAYFITVGKFDFWGHWGALAILLLVSLPITIFFSDASFRIIERPIIEAAKNNKRLGTIDDSASIRSR